MNKDCNESGKDFFNSYFTTRKCRYGSVFGFNVSRAKEFIGAASMGDALRTFVRESMVELSLKNKQSFGTHIKHNYLANDLRVALFKGCYCNPI